MAEKQTAASPATTKFNVTARSLRGGPTNGHLRAGKHWSNGGSTHAGMDAKQLTALKADSHIVLQRVETVGPDGKVLEVLESNFTASGEAELKAAKAEIEKLKAHIEAEGASFRAQHYPLQEAHEKLKTELAGLKTEHANALEKVTALEAALAQAQKSAKK